MREGVINVLLTPYAKIRKNLRMHKFRRTNLQVCTLVPISVQPFRRPALTAMIPRPIFTNLAKQSTHLRCTFRLSFGKKLSLQIRTSTIHFKRSWQRPVPCTKHSGKYEKSIVRDIAKYLGKNHLSALRANWPFPSSSPYESKLSTDRKPKTAGRLRDQLHSFLRRRRDSNPRNLSVQQFSRLPPSTTRPHLRVAAAKLRKIFVFFAFLRTFAMVCESG